MTFPSSSELNATAHTPVAVPSLGRGPAAAIMLANSLAIAGALHGQADLEASLGEAHSLDSVTVSGERERPLSTARFSQPLVNTPQTVVVIPPVVYTQQGATNLSEVLRNTPGITFAAGEGGSVASGDSFYMRGFDTSGSIFIDGVRDTGGYNRDVFNIGNVEISKGPAGADSGRGGASGSVNLVTKTANLESDSTASAMVGTDGQKRATVDVNHVISNSPLPGTAVRLNALWQDSDESGRDEVYHKSTGLSPSVSFGLGTPTRVSLVGTYVKQENLPDSGLPVVAVPGGAVLPPSIPALTQSVRQENYYGLANEDYDRVRHVSALAKIEHDFTPDVTLSNQTKVAETDRDALTTYVQNSATTASTFPPATTPVNPATGAPPPAYISYTPATQQITPRRLHNETENVILTNQSLLTAVVKHDSFVHNAGAGLDLTREDQFAPTWSPTGAPPTDLFHPDPARTSGPDQRPYRASNDPYTQTRIDSAAAYLFDTLEIGKHWILNGSLRFEHYDTQYANLAAATPSAPTPSLAELSSDGDLVNTKAGVTFKPTRDISLYAAFGNSSTPPGSGLALSSSASSADNPIFDPQEATNYEVGAKGEFLDQRINLSLALYRSENKNVVTQDAATLNYVQDASQTVQGVEIGVSGKVTKDWLLFGGFAYMESEYGAPPTSTGGANNGAALRFTPRVSANLWSTYALPHGFTIGAGFQYSDSVVRSTANSVTSTSPSLASAPEYWLLNAMVAYAVNRNVTLRLNVNNITDETYIRLNNNGGRYYPGAARTALLTADIRF